MSDSIWKKELSFKRKPKPEAAAELPPDAAAPSQSLWKKELSLKKKKEKVESPDTGPKQSVWKKEISFSRREREREVERQPRLQRDEQLAQGVRVPREREITHFRQCREHGAAALRERDAVGDPVRGRAGHDLGFVVEARLQQILREPDREHADQQDRDERDGQRAAEERPTDARREEGAERAAEARHISTCLRRSFALPDCARSRGTP